LKTAKKSAQTVFTNYRRLVLVSDDSVREVTEAFPRYDFRTLVSPAAATMVQLPNRDGPGIYIVVPRRSVSQNEVRRQVEGSSRFSSPSDQEGTDVEVYIQKRLKAVRVDGDYAGRIEFLKFLMSNFRRRAFDWLVRSASADARYAGDPMQQQLLLAPLAQAVHRHLKTYPDPYLEELAIDESSMGIKGELDRKTFQDAWKRIIDTEPVITTPLPPIHLHDLGRTADQASGFMEASLGTGREKILVDQIQALTQNLGDLLAHSLHIQDWRNPPTPENWVKSLVAQDLSQADPAVKELSTSALNFFKAMMSADSRHPCCCRCRRR
jgi:hypothetical protein